MGEVGARGRLKTRDVMSKSVKRIEQGATLAEAMLKEKVSSLVVIPAARDEPFGGRLRCQNYEGERGCGDASVVITPGVPVSHAAKTMKRTNVRRLAAFNGREIVGIISNVDVLRALRGRRKFQFTKGKSMPNRFQC